MKYCCDSFKRSKEIRLYRPLLHYLRKVNTLLTWLIFPLIRRCFESCLPAKKVDCQNRPLDQQHRRNHKDVCSKIIRTLQMSLTGKRLLLAL